MLNYRAATGQAEKMLTGGGALPLCQRVLKAAHKVLMRGVRGANKSPARIGAFPTGSDRPAVTVRRPGLYLIAADQFPQAMAAWERYIHSEAPDRLAQLAILHAEFEALHPFLDGNGRLGRRLAPLFLWQAELIRAPVFYMSAHLETHRDAYLFCLASPAWSPP
ncbi:MAG: Fic family protein [Cyanobacteria bacterium MAG CAR3_bin_5]|nr:Fic family protein [Cyanobacteria bacterium MAG CAR3_bin_5]